VYATPTKPGRRATGLDLLEAAARRERTGLETRPWFAIGGIDAASLGDVRLAGARRIVVVRAITEASEPAAAAARLSGLMHEKISA
jgi:thiamine-phosphate pyrophosphorylase